MGRLAPAAAVLALAVLAGAAAASPGRTALGSGARTRAVVERVAWETSDGRARLVVAVRGAVDYTTHLAGADPQAGLPPRTYVDLRPAVLGKDVPRTPQPADDALAVQVRVGQFDPETVRVVVDLREPALFDVRTSERPPRLLLGLKRIEKPATVARARPTPAAEPARVAEAPVPEPSATAAPQVVAQVPSAAPAAPPSVVPPPVASAGPEPPVEAPEARGLPEDATRAELVAAAPEPSPAPPERRGTPQGARDLGGTPQRAREAGRAAAKPGGPPARGAKGVKSAKSAKGAKNANEKVPRPEPSPRAWTVVLDPGHGGRDPGARGVSGDYEKDITLALSVLVAEQLADDRQIRVVLTRVEDTYVSLEQRTAIANAEGADLFVSIHANASENPRLAGVETYTLNNTDDRATIRLAALENGLALTGATPGESDLAYILSDLVQTGKEDESVTLARAVQSNLVSYLRERWRGVADLGVKKGPFYVLVGAYMPCILVEVAFLTNETEGQRIAARRYQLDVAEGVARGIRRFLASDTANSNL